MLKGITIENGVTKNESKTDVPCFVHRRLIQGQSDFHSFFKPIITNSKFYWAFLNTPELWSFPHDWIDEMTDLDDEETPGTIWYNFHNCDYVVRKPEDGRSTKGYMLEGKLYRDHYCAGIYTNDFMKKYSFIVNDDWNELMAIDPNVKEYDDILTYFLTEGRSSAQNASKVIEEYAEWYFVNVDGLFWNFYTKDENDLLLIKNHLKKYDTVKIKNGPMFDITKVNPNYAEHPSLLPKEKEEADKISKEMERIVKDMFKSTFETDEDFGKKN